MHSYIKEKLEGHNFAMINQMLENALAQVNWSRLDIFYQVQIWLF
jgi:hypothetical protein